MCRRATQRPPRIRERLHLLHRRPRFQAEADPHRFLHSEIASRPRIAVTEAEQQINVGGPRPDAMQLRERRMRSVGVFFRKHIEIEAFGTQFARDELQRLDLRG